jgi:hypothetical protein
MRSLRALVLLLLFANAVYFAWSHNLFGGWGPSPVTEPHRLEQQVQPELLQLSPRIGPAPAPGAAPGPGGGASSSSYAPAQAVTVDAMSAAADLVGMRTVADNSAPGRQAECLVAGTFDEAEAGVLRQALSARLPASAWGFEPVVITPARWVVHMGRYPNAEAVERKKAELRAMKVAFDTPSNPSLMPGLALGRFDSEAAATQELASLTRRGVRTAHVAVERAEQRGLQVRLPAVDEGMKSRLGDMRAALAGKALKPCAV